MYETLDQLDGIGRDEERAAMATLVATKGTTPRREGAKMWVGSGGRILGSVTIGGCVDARVIALAEQVLATSRAELLSMSLGDEAAWELGLTCGGTVEVYIEPVSPRDRGDPVRQAYERIRREVRCGRPAAMVTPLRHGGGRLVITAESSEGTLGDPMLERTARERAQSLMAAGTSRLVDLGGEEKPFEAFVEVHEPRRTLLVFGAGHVAMPLIEMAKPLGLRTVLIDARERFATAERFPDAGEIRIGIPSEIAAALEITPTTAVVLVAHDYKYDLPILRTVLASPAGYVGMLGSRRRGRAILDLLAEEGMTAEHLSRVHVPIGLDIGAQSAAEIALSILAEVVAARSGRSELALSAGARA